MRPRLIAQESKRPRLQYFAEMKIYPRPIKRPRLIAQDCKRPRLQYFEDIKNISIFISCHAMPQLMNCIL